MTRRKNALKAAQPSAQFTPPLPINPKVEEEKIGKAIHAAGHKPHPPSGSVTQAHSSKQLDSAYDAMVM